VWSRFYYYAVVRTVLGIIYVEDYDRMASAHKMAYL